MTNYQNDSRVTWRDIACDVSPSVDTYCVLGLLGEAGELADKIKKIFRDQGGVVRPEDRAAIMLELGDILWYWSQIATGFNLTEDEIKAANMTKILDRQRRGVIGGNGDYR